MSHHVRVGNIGLRGLLAAGIVALAALAGGRAGAAETPSSYGEASTVDTPILRIPFIKTPPTIDGKMEAGEWEDSSALSGFWYDFAAAKFIYLAPHQLQVVVHAAYDKDNLYLAYISPVFPNNSWLKQNGRFPDVMFHPNYGLIWDDHIELEIRPYEDNRKGYQLGLFKWFMNPFDTVGDLYWSIQAGERKAYNSKVKSRSFTDAERWTLEIAIPLERLIHGQYKGERENGRPIVHDPPVSEQTAYRAWFTRGIGGNSKYFTCFDAHVWNTTKTKLIFDAEAPSFQLNNLGPFMDDIIDVELTVKNHNVKAAGVRSKTVRVGFFVENEEGNIYSSFDAPELEDGKLEIVPGQTRTIRLKKYYPGVSTDGNVLWFDVRSAGNPGKVLYRTRLQKFHTYDGGKIRVGEEWVDFRERRMDVIEEIRPERKAFDFRWEITPYGKRFAAVVDKGIPGATPEAKSAVEAKILVLKNNRDEDEVASFLQPFRGNFAMFDTTIPDLVKEEEYTITLLLFDENKRIVGERNIDPFPYQEYVWQNNKLGKNDVVWGDYTDMEVTDDGFNTLKHNFSLAPSGLPAQIHIKPDPRELPLEIRDGGEPDEAILREISRGDQLRAPVRLVAVIDGKPVEAEVTSPAELVRQWKSELEYASELSVGGMPVTLTTQYEVDGSMHCKFDYGEKGGKHAIESFQLVMDAKGVVDMAVSTAMGGGGMASADVFECSLPDKKGIIWDSATLETMELYYSNLVPWFWFGNGDRAWTFYTDSDRGWGLAPGSVVTLERDDAGEVTLRVRFVNHEQTVDRQRHIEFSILTHPTKPKPKTYRREGWMYRGVWADEYFVNHTMQTAEELREKSTGLAKKWHNVENLDDVTYEMLDKPPYHRYYQIRAWGWTQYEKQDPSQKGNIRLNQMFEDKFTYHLARGVTAGKRTGYWWDETWPVKRSNSIAQGDAYLRDPEEVGERELPWQDTFLTQHMRNMMKRLARVQKEHNVPLKHIYWANNSATLFAPFGWDSQTTEGCSGGHASYDIDFLTAYPSPLFRYHVHNFTGLIHHCCPGPPVAKAGDNPDKDRQIIGRALLHDVGASFSGPHGNLDTRAQPVRLVRTLHNWGYFEPDGKTEVIFYYRHPKTVHFGDEPQPSWNGVYATAFRRPLEDGKGYKALIIILNESLEDQTRPLVIRNPERLFGAAGNTLTAAEARERMGTAPEGLEGWLKAAGEADADTPVLWDIERKTVVRKAKGDGERYGPLFVPCHDYRLLYAESRE